MEKVTAQFYQWLRSRDLDPDKIKLVIRADDAMTRERIIVAVKSELQLYQLKPHADLNDLTSLKMNGIGVSFSSIDHR